MDKLQLILNVNTLKKIINENRVAQFLAVYQVTTKRKFM